MEDIDGEKAEEEASTPENGESKSKGKNQKANRNDNKQNGFEQVSSL
jgi:hypothetical protein